MGEALKRKFRAPRFVSDNKQEERIQPLVALVLTTSLLILILYYETTTLDTPSERFMDSQSLGVRILLTAFGTAVGTFWDNSFPRRYLHFVLALFPPCYLTYLGTCLEPTLPWVSTLQLIYSLLYKQIYLYPRKILRYSTMPQTDIFTLHIYHHLLTTP